jgi:hypothetical protein
MTDPEDIAPGEHLDPDERDPEAPEADLVEQATPAEHGYDAVAASDSIEAPEWDAHEQSLVVELEDEYR